MEAVRYPDDFDGIIAGAPANNQFQLGAWRINLDTTIRKDTRRIVPRNKMLLVNRAVLEICDTLDGVKDGLLSDPMKCHFDPSTLLCRGAENENCLTAAQVEAVKMAYAPVKKRNGELIYPGLVPGGEADWPISAFNSVPDPGRLTWVSSATLRTRIQRGIGALSIWSGTPLLLLKKPGMWKSRIQTFRSSRSMAASF
jgi:hypothetical protein